MELTENKKEMIEKGNKVGFINPSSVNTLLINCINSRGKQEDERGRKE